MIFNPKKPIRCGKPEWDGQAFALDDPHIPAPIREAARAIYRPGDALYFNNTRRGGEWWLMRGDDLVETFWL